MAPSILIYEENRAYVLEQYHNGHFDYIEVIQEVAQRDFFHYIARRGVLTELARNYPWPRSKEEVPAWFYLVADMAMRLHGNHAFHGFPWVVRTGGLLTAFGPELGRKWIDADGGLRVECRGFNRKNDYPRQTPCDPDFLRKIAKDTPAEALMNWYNQEVAKIFRQQRFFDKAGIFIGDASYIFVPDNEHYEGSVKMLFDEHNHPVSAERQQTMSRVELKKCRWRRCLKMVSLLHTNAQGEFFLYAGVRILPGNVHECPVLWEMVAEFVSCLGKGVIKDLIIDRGFLDGEQIGRAKTEYGIEVTIGVKRNMDILQDALGLAKMPETKWTSYERPATEPPLPFKRHLTSGPKPEHILKREAARQRTLQLQKASAAAMLSRPESLLLTRLPQLNSWSSCPVPLDLVLCRQAGDETWEHVWGILSTAREEAPEALLERYHLRVLIEERHRHLKCFWDLADFSSPDFAMVVNQVVFTVLTYSLLQQQILRQGRKALNKASKSRLLEELVPVAENITVFTDQYYVCFSTLEYTELAFSVSEQARQKLLALVQKKKREMRLRLLDPP